MVLLQLHRELFHKYWWWFSICNAKKFTKYQSFIANCFQKFKKSYWKTSFLNTRGSFKLNEFTRSIINTKAIRELILSFLYKYRRVFFFNIVHTYIYFKVKFLLDEKDVKVVLFIKKGGIVHLFKVDIPFTISALSRLCVVYVLSMSCIYILSKPCLFLVYVLSMHFLYLCILCSIRL